MTCDLVTVMNSAYEYHCLLRFISRKSGTRTVNSLKVLNKVRMS